MDFIIKEIDPANDLAQLAKLLSLVLPQRITTERLQEIIHLPAQKQRRTIAVDNAARCLGYSALLRDESMPP